MTVPDPLASAREGQPTPAASRAVWRAWWSWRGWTVTIAVSIGIGIAAVVSGGPWWTGAVLAAVIPAALYLTQVRENLTWVGYRKCPTCEGYGRVKTDA